MTTRYSKYIRPIQEIVVYLILNFSFLLAYSFKFGDIEGVFSRPHYLNLYIFFNVSWYGLTLMFRPFDISRVSGRAKPLAKLTSVILLHLLLVTAFIVAFKIYLYSREQIFTTYFFLLLLALLWEGAFITFLRNYRQRGFNTREVVVYGFGKLSKELAHFLSTHPELGYKLQGFFDDSSQEQEVSGSFQDLEKFSLENDIAEIYCCLPYVAYDQVQKLIAFGERNLIKVKVISDFRGFSSKGLELERYDHIPVLNVTPSPLEDLQVKVFKRSFDLLFSVSFIILASPVYAMVAIITWLTSPGPILYKQERIGQLGKPFVIYKFRSMGVNSEKEGPCLSSRSDQRVTRWGKFIRKTRLDELPQFFNVVRGEMSVVGPRPERKYFIDQIVEQVPYYNRIHMVKPGITSLGQVKFGYAENVPEMIQRLKYDIFYLKNFSFAFDIKMIMLTALIVLQGKGK